MLAAVMLLGMVGGYIAGSIFDSVMGTHITPLLAVGSAVLGLFSGTKVDKDSSLGGAILALMLLPFVALFGALMASLFFPESSVAFMAMIGYTGSLYGLAFWGSLTMAVARVIVLLLMLMIILPIAAVFSR
jgi:hypothetical protein